MGEAASLSERRDVHIFDVDERATFDLWITDLLQQRCGRNGEEGGPNHEVCGRNGEQGSYHMQNDRDRREKTRRFTHVKPLFRAARALPLSYLTEPIT